MALVVGTADLIIAGVGASNPSLAGYGGLKETVISLALLLVCVPLFLFRRLWQDRGTTFLWREPTPHLPTDREGVADEYADLDGLTVGPDAPLTGGHEGPSVQPI